MSIVAACFLLKNEAEYISKSLDSLPKQISIVVVNDTGSTDDTRQVVENHCKAANRKLVYKCNLWQNNFSLARNQLFDLIPDQVTHLVLLDASDEMINIDPEWFLKLDEHQDRWLVQQHWWDGLSEIRFSNTRLIRNCANWNWVGCVHEALENESAKEPVVWDGFVIYQDRTKDGGQSKKRWQRDLLLLMEDDVENPNNPRTVFYLAQTLDCLGRKQEAAIHYERRLNLIGFFEERYVAAMYCAQNQKDPTEFANKALEIMWRAEPLVLLAKYHRQHGRRALAYVFASMACDLDLPNCTLWFNVRMYDYDRWSELSIVAWYVQMPGAREKGKAACIKAQEHGNDQDAQNLKFYM